MSILIKGMQMPIRCSDCPMCYDFISCQLADKGFGEIDCVEVRADWCPLIELPPHGRLIDADALLQHQWVSSDWNCGGVHEIVVSITDIDDAPTIIESEGEE